MRKLLIIIFTFIASNSFALQIKDINDNGTVNVNISSQVLNRIYVHQDRIVEVFGMNNTYKLQKDETDGSIFIIPTSEYKNQSINLFIKTELGRHYTLHLIPIETDAQTIGLKSNTPLGKKACLWESSTSYEDALITLIKKMANCDDPPEGYAVIAVNQKERKQGCLVFKLKKIYRGDALEGQIWLVTNAGSRTIQVNPDHFTDDRIKAAAFERNALRPHETTRLFWVKKHGT